MTIALSHGTFTLQRIWAAPPAHIFTAWTDPNLRAQWLTGPPEKWEQLRRSLDFRTGGLEVIEGRLKDGGTVTYHEVRFHLIEPGQRVIYACDMHLAGSFHCVTLASVVLSAAGDKTHVSCTEQITFLDGRDGTADRQQGIDSHLTRLQSALQLQP